MPFIDLGNEFKDAKEIPMAQEGEYDLICDKVTHDEENGKNNLIVDIKFEGGEYQGFRTWVSLPQPEKDKIKDAEKGNPEGSMSKFKMLMAKRFCSLFNVPFTETGFDTNDIPGARARAGVTIGEANDKGKRYQNLIIPRLPDEE